MEIDIIGGGIGGLTTAIALRQKGHQIRVFEQAPALRTVGAGIILGNNAMQVYDELGLRPALEQAGYPIERMSITDRSLRDISSMDLRPFATRFGFSNLAIHRAALQQTLVAALPSDCLLLGNQLTKISTEPPYQLQFSDGSAAISPALVAADGLRSLVRQRFFPETRIRQAGQLCWRGVVDYSLPERFHRAFAEAWGPGVRFGFGPIAEGQVYWFAVAKESLTQTYEEAFWPELFRDFHPLVRQLIEATPKDSVHRDALADLRPIRQWTIGHLCLLGDAAHATTPNMGQGAGQAIEDARVLAACLDQEDDPSTAFQRYQRIRRPKAHWVVKNSWRLGQVAHWQGPLWVGLRNQLLRMSPPSVSRRTLERSFRLDALTA